MTPLKAFIAAVVGTTFVAAPLSGTDVELAEERTTLPRGWHEVARLPDDPALPALGAMHASGLTGGIPVLDLDGRPVELVLLGYTPGRRATIEVRGGNRRVVIKAYVDAPALEAELYQTVAATGLLGASGVHLPTLLAYDADLKALVIDWLEGPTLGRLIKEGKGGRAGELAARWIRCSAGLPVRLGQPVDLAQLLKKALRWAATLGVTDSELGPMAAAVGRRLSATAPTGGPPCLVHGSLYDRHLFDMGDGPGLIDWDSFGQGTLELDAGVFLASVKRTGLRNERMEAESSRAVEAFLAETAGLLDARTLAWYRAVALLRFAHKRGNHPGEGRERPDALLQEALRVVEATG